MLLYLRYVKLQFFIKNSNQYLNYLYSFPSPSSPPIASTGSAG